MNVKPCGHRVIVKPDKLHEVQAQSLGSKLKDIGFQIETGGDKKRIEGGVVTGILVSVGPNAWKGFDDGHPWAKEGDRVYFAKYGGYLIEDPDTKEEYRLLNDEDITAVVAA